MDKEFLKCDAAYCDHVEEVPEITEGMVGKPCPLCGANLLTQEDWDQWKVMVAMVRAVQSFAPTADDDSDKVMMRVGLHGDKTSIEISKP